MFYFKSPLGWLKCLLVTSVCFSCNSLEEITPEIQDIADILLENESGIDEDLFLASTVNYRLGDWNMVFEETFEGSNPFNNYVHKQFAASYSFKKVNSPVLMGNGSGRFELRKSDDIVTESGVRAEVLFQRPKNKDSWYSFGIYLPSNGFAKDPHNDVLSQWHEGGSPKISFRVANDVFRLRLLDKNSNPENISLATATKNTWHEFVFHIIHSGGSDGLVEVWHNGNKVATKKGPNNFASHFPAWKIGIYKPGWGKGTSTSNLRVAYFDNVRIGDENSQFEEMNPPKENPKDWGPVVPDTDQINLVNAHTNRKVKAVTDGESISTSDLGTNKISFMTEMGTDFKGSVKLQLVGPKNHTQVENEGPYSLFGDSNGEYYDGGGLPLGKYSLTVTPYDERSGKGKAGSPKTITFRIVDTRLSTSGSQEDAGEKAAEKEQTASVGASPLQTFTLIQSNTNSEWGLISDGMRLDASDLGTHKLTVRANMEPGFKGGVKFELSGTVNRVATSTSFPFVLNNYSNGNYTFGKGLPKGSYTLIATPYRDVNGYVDWVEPTTIRFQIN